MQRRTLLTGLAAVIATGRAPPLVAGSGSPQHRLGPMSGDILDDRAMLLAFADRPARLLVEWADDPGFRRPVRREGGLATPATGLTARLDLDGLPSARTIHYRTALADPDDSRRRSDWEVGRLTTPGGPGSIRFAFAGDEGGQGFGINPDFGGYRLYEAMRRLDPHFFIHQGDQIYADGPMKAELPLPGGGIWKNRLVPEKETVATSLDGFRGNFAYNLLDENKRRFLAQTAFLAQWDDHEVINNWYPGQDLPAPPPMAARIVAARQAMLEYNPIRLDPRTGGIERRFGWGPLLDIFLLDARTHRQPNRFAGGPEEREAPVFGPAQMRWLEAGLAASRATWKLIASDIPISLTVPDLNRYSPKGAIEGLANGRPGAPGGREPELAGLLARLKARGVRNIVWIAADVHYAAALRYDPARATGANFDPFWEFVAGPINAGTGSIDGNPLDPTFGPEVVHATVPTRLADPSPRSGNQFFGFGAIEPRTRVLRMAIHDLDGRERFAVDLEPA
jgi:alkaline phosphatase D